ncbi:MAG TPA: SpoIVB peptidase S55 domain-containing protein [Acidobacteriota bacterium]|nr:SpoIVB peptidase S55 domain-containing protein [Acidobacteriota bacterium]
MLIIPLFAFFTFAAHATEIMPLSEVKVGMTGVGRTVFKGANIEEFQVEILGVLNNYLPQQNLILATLKGGNLEDTGVIAGMSGSPVFINGKMIGAVSYAWPFSKTPIAGITPIESMMKTQTVTDERIPIAPPVEVAQYYNFENLLTNHLARAPQVSATLAGLGKIELMPIASPLMVSGFDPGLVEKFTPLFSTFGLQPVLGGSSGTAAEDRTTADASLQPGSALSVQLIDGDVDIGAIGTVSYRDKNKVLAFGHPFFNLGPINFPMATAEIFAVVPNLYSSFKIGSARTVVGSIRQDQQAAIFGIVGSDSPMIPVTVNLKNEQGEKRTFHFNVANHNLLSPVLVDFAFQNSIMVTQLGLSESTLKVNGTVQIKDRAPVQITNIFSGSGSFANASQYVASILYAVMANEFKHVDIQSVNIDVDTVMKKNDADLLEVWLDRNEVRPGETVQLKAMYRPSQGTTQVENFQIKMPDDLQGQQVYFIVGGGQEITRQEFALYGKAYQPDSLDQLITLLNGLRSNDRIYVKAFTNEPSLLMKGQFLSSLPSSVYSALASSQTIGSAQRISRLSLGEDSRPVNCFLTGTRVFSLRVLPRRN